MQSTARVILFLGLSGMLSVVSMHSALAQGTTATATKIKRPIRISLGEYFPSDGNVRNTVGKSFTSFGLSYDFHATQTTLPLIFGVYLADSTKTKNISLGKSTVKAEAGYIGLGIQARTYFVPESNSLRYYAGGGLGMYSLRAKSGVKQGNTLVSVSKTGTRLGGKIFGGVEWKKRYFGEIEGVFTGPINVQGATFDLSGLSASVGLRF